MPKRKSKETMKTPLLPSYAIFMLLVLFTHPSMALNEPSNINDLRINQIQIVGSHNSYHAGLSSAEQKVWQLHFPELYRQINYSHPSLTQQLDDGVRQFELDIAADARGGLYAHTVMEDLLAQAGLKEDVPMQDTAVMNAPGFKLIHIAGLDQRSNCQPLTSCLEELKRWSERHPTHLPIYILLETIDSREGPALSSQFKPLHMEYFSSQVFDALDQDLAKTLGRRNLITPDDVRGTYRTLPEAISQRGWPKVREARGKYVVLLDQKSVGATYLVGHPALRHRIMFTNADPGNDDAAFIEVNDGPASRISCLVQAGYLVRTRADADLHEASTNDVRRGLAMEASGAQLISTDFPLNEKSKNGYAFSFPGGQAARPDPIRASPSVLQARNCVN